MLILVLAIVLTLAWLFVRRLELDELVLRRAAIGCAIALAGVVVAVRAGPVALGLFIAAASLALWLHWRGADGGWGGGGGDPPPPDPEPDPGEGLHPETLDRDAFDQARAEWERELPQHR